jgi:hypothetical protein
MTKDMLFVDKAPEVLDDPPDEVEVLDDPPDEVELLERALAWKASKVLPSAAALIANTIPIWQCPVCLQYPHVG